MACFNYCLRECMTGETTCLCSDIQVQLFWVPGQCGIIGNGEADDLVGVGSDRINIFIGWACY
jgi:hypothetical protein